MPEKCVICNADLVSLANGKFKLCTTHYNAQKSDLEKEIKIAIELRKLRDEVEESFKPAP